MFGRSSSESVNTLSFLTYNIDGLNPVNLNYRTNTVLALIVSANADIVQLQEVVPETAPIIIKALINNGYSNFGESNAYEGSCHYFTLTFAKVRKFSSCAIRRIPYTGSASSQQGRDSLQLSLVYMGVPWLFVNCHLESCGVAFKSAGSAIRQAQLTHGLRLVTEHTTRGPAVLAGDLNIRDPEASAVRKLFGSDISDASEVCMIDKKKSATWYMPAPSTYSARYDRVYYNSTPGLVAKTFQIIGGDDIYEDLPDGNGFNGEALPYRTPSDHRGLVVEFQFTAPAAALSRSVGGYGAMTGCVPAQSGANSAGRAADRASSSCSSAQSSGRQESALGGKRKLPVPEDAEVICLSSDDDEDDAHKARKLLDGSTTAITRFMKETAPGSDVAAGQGNRGLLNVQEVLVDTAEAKQQRRKLQLLAAERRAMNSSRDT
jgi:endonuclease/exonuclease/phosphatase family metal-dependent hydrolase